MHDLNVIDQFLQTFIRYIDGGFGILNGNVASLASILIAIDITIAGLFWAMEGEANVLGRLIKKVLYVGAFAFIINNFSSLADIIFRSFSGLGLEATGSTLSPADLLKPGKLAGIGFQAAWPLLQQAGKYFGITGIFSHFVTILVLCFAWAIVILSFFILAVQLFVTILEFKLTTLVGFVLVPFALWGRTAFLAERVLGNVVASGVKVMVLAVVVGIGTTFFQRFVHALPGPEVTLNDAMTLVLASLALFGLGIFGPGIATGLVAGGPQLAAGSAIGTGAALAGGALLTAGSARLAGATAMGAIRAGTALSSGAGTAYSLGKATSGAGGMAGVGAGLSAVSRAGLGLAAGGIQSSAQAGRLAAWRASGGTGADEGAAMNAAPAWARRLQRHQRMRGHAHMASQAIKDGDRGGHGFNPSVREE